MSYSATNAFELEFIITGIVFDVQFENGYFDDDEKKEIKSMVDSLSREIHIDKSYVECKSNLRSGVFMLENGWNSLRDLLIDTEFGKWLAPESYPVLVDAFCVMAKCYIYECLSSLKTSDMCRHIAIDIAKDCEFDVMICKDTSNDWKNYPGKWQKWEFDDNGNFKQPKV